MEKSLGKSAIDCYHLMVNQLTDAKILQKEFLLLFIS